MKFYDAKIISYTNSLGFCVEQTDSKTFYSKGFEFEAFPKSCYTITVMFGKIYKWAIDEIPHITEIHANYRDGRIAFESDMDQTGYTYDLSDILGFYAKEVEK